MADDQTEKEPPNMGVMYLPRNGSTRKSKNEPRNVVI
jgi:hypothetical protein